MRLSDDELLRQYVTLRDDTAFETLVRRHGPMVRRVCLRILSNAADVKDAFQATLLCSAQGGQSAPRRVGRLAVRRGPTRRPRRAAPGQEASGPGNSGRGKPARTDLSAGPRGMPRRLAGGFRSGIRTFAEQVSNACGALLPGGENQRRGGTAAWAARGKIAGTLARARDLLRGRLVRRGVTVSGGTLAAWLTQETAKAASVAVGVQSAAKGATLAALGKGATVTSPANTLAGRHLESHDLGQGKALGGAEHDRSRRGDPGGRPVGARA